ncbi:MAG: toll/interleukin-1 receptor domain-containing protein [Verrucomicrobiia bacterium]
MSEKKTVFLSHIAEEKELAILFKNLIEDHFLGLIDVFVSSDERNIGLGQKWLDDITNSLKQCVAEVILCSPVSIKRPWINFEAGAGWIRDIPVIPLCHSGVDPSSLPLPLSLLQAAKASEVSSLKLVFPVLANALGSRTPTVDFTAFIQEAASFEARYTFWNQCNSGLAFIKQHYKDIWSTLEAGKTVSLDLTEVQIAELEKATTFLQTNNILNVRRVGRSTVSETGVFSGCDIVPMPRLTSILNNPECKI